jgi:uncharacterized protein (TIGR02594 family)
MNKPRWVLQAENNIGVKEVKGATHNPVIVQYWKDIRRGGIKDDETPWCAAFVGSMLERCGIQSTRFESAKSYLSWGEKLDRPVYGCVAVFSRDGGGHVGFVVGKDKAGNLLVLGGNQDDAVNVKSFPLSRKPIYRWPQGEPVPAGDLPVGDSVAMSRSEA